MSVSEAAWMIIDHGRTRHAVTLAFTVMESQATLEEIADFYREAWTRANDSDCPDITITPNGWFNLGFKRNFRRDKVLEMAQTLVYRWSIKNK